ncbi:MAG: hypothetical protein ABIF17_04725 [Patescibacteria group bacterium]
MNLLTGSTHVDNLKKIEASVNLLKEQQLEIDRLIGNINIKNELEVFGKLCDNAKQEDVERTVKKILEKAQGELCPKIDNLANSIKELAEKKDCLWKKIESEKKILSGEWDKIKILFNQAEEMLGHESTVKYDFREVLRSAKTLQDIKDKLSEVRKKLGMFKFKEKAAIDFILSKIKGLDTLKLANTNISDFKEQLNQFEAENVGLSEQFKGIVLSSWDAQNKINELTGEANSYKLPFDLKYRLEIFIEKFADLKRYENHQCVGIHEGWYNACQYSKNRFLYETFKAITEINNPDGLDIIHFNPKKT